MDASKHTPDSGRTFSAENATYEDWTYTGEGSATAHGELFAGALSNDKARVVVHELAEPGKVSFEMTCGEVNGTPSIGVTAQLTADEIEEFAQDLLAMADGAREIEEDTDEQ